MKRIPLVFLLVLAGCDSLRLREARVLEGMGRYPQAARVYEKFIETAAGPLAVEAHFRAADLYALKLQDCADSRRHYEWAARLAAGEPSVSRARAGIMSCPDYFPLAMGRTWVYGDSAEGGRDMRLESDVTDAAAGAGEVRSVLYAGSKRVRVQRAQYEKKDWQVLEILPTGASAAVLRFPFNAGQSWTASRGEERLSYTIEDSSARVVTAAGAFSHCLKVREFNPQFPDSWKYDYYAPFVGRVKTTVGGPGFENPNTELIRYSAGQSLIRE